MQNLSAHRSGLFGDFATKILKNLRLASSALITSVPVVLLANVLLLAAPHARGIDFFPALRYVIVAPVCVIVTLLFFFLYRALAKHSKRPRLNLALSLAVCVAIVQIAMLLAGPPGIAEAAVPALFGAAVAVAWLVPRRFDQRGLSRTGMAVIICVGALELIALAGALASEWDLPSDSRELAFDVPRAMFDVEHRFVTLPGGARVHYVDEGAGETLLFLHGNPSWSFQWRDLIHGLRDSYRCVALDYPGFGLSRAPDGFGFTPREESLVVEEFVEHLGLRDVTLVMQDWGGPIGLGFAGRRPELVRRMILGSTWAWPTGTDEPRGRFSKIVGGPLGEFLQINFDIFPRLAIDHGIVRELRPDVLDVYARPFRPLHRRGIAIYYPGQITQATKYFAEIEAGLPRLADRPALIFWALQDPGFPRTDLARFERSFPRHRTIELPDANHFFYEDVPELMIREIRAFLSSY